jgi:hypothetical protein
MINAKRNDFVLPLTELATMTLNPIFFGCSATDPANRISDTDDRKKTFDRLNIAPGNRRIDRNATVWQQGAAARACDAQDRNQKRSADGLPHGSNENKMSDGGRERAPLGVAVWKSSEMWIKSGPSFAPSHG